MCGITFIFDEYYSITNIKTLSHRGPDQYSEKQTEMGLFIFDRLSINDIENGEQPFDDGVNTFMCNGEIYNHKELESLYNIETKTQSDCEVVFGMLNKCHSTFGFLDAEFACVYTSGKEVIASRDRFGVRPLYVAYSDDNNIMGFSSESKGFDGLLKPTPKLIKQFPPCCYWSSKSPKHFVSYNSMVRYRLKLYNEELSYERQVETVRKLVTEAVRKRVEMSSRPVAYFLSGGLDSSIVAAIGASLSKTPINVYSVGIRGGKSPDIEASKLMAKHLGANHIIIEFDLEDAVKRVPEVIKTLESYDCTTIRASVPMYILSEYISKYTDDKVILSGEGADELFGGYLYFHNAPSDAEFHSETLRLLENIHQYDSLRADRCTAAHGLELRAPFLDLSLADYVTTKIPSSMLNPSSNGGLEKRILRDAFCEILPNEICTRQKNGMSDAVGYSWVDYLKEISSEKVKNKLNEYKINTPLTDEELWYRNLYQSFYGETIVSHEGIWRPLWNPEGITDPSARMLKNFKEL
jgi:asparagine synthase (glutamine-hydrolysing)